MHNQPPDFARIATLTVRAAIKERRLSYDEVAAKLETIGYRHREGGSFSGAGLRRALQLGQVSGALMVAITMALGLKTLRVRGDTDD